MRSCTKSSLHSRAGSLPTPIGWRSSAPWGRGFQNSATRSPSCVIAPREQQRAWTNAEARYLLEIANRRLTLDHDWGSALAALQAADERLQSLKDPSLNPTRRALASEIQALRNVVQPDLPGITARLCECGRDRGLSPGTGGNQGGLFAR